jgi:hypothetical protein
LEILWYHIFGPLVGFGNRPWRVLYIGIFIVAMGYIVFQIGYVLGGITPKVEGAYLGATRQISERYPRFNAFGYSLETAVPLLQLGIGDYWAPDPSRVPNVIVRIGMVRISSLAWGRSLPFYVWCHMIAGRILTILWVGSLIGVFVT